MVRYRGKVVAIDVEDEPSMYTIMVTKINRENGLLNRKGFSRGQFIFTVLEERPFLSHYDPRVIGRKLDSEQRNDVRNTLLYIKSRDYFREMEDGETITSEDAERFASEMGIRS